MKKLLTLLLIPVTVLLFTSCNAKSTEQNSDYQTDLKIKELSYSDTVTLLSEINEILTAASKGAGNPLSKIGGFSEELDTIKSMSDSIITDVEQMIDAIDEKEDSAVLYDNSINIAMYHKNFETKLSEVKKAKQDTDISSLKSYLSEMIELIEEYQVFLDELEEELFQ